MANKSRPKRWAEAVNKAQEAASALRTAVEELVELQNEYEEWRDNLPENGGNASTIEKLDAIVDLDLSVIDAVDDTVSEAEGIELPLGFGRD